MCAEGACPKAVTGGERTLAPPSREPPHHVRSSRRHRLSRPSSKHRLARREFLKGGLAAAVAAALPLVGCAAAPEARPVAIGFTGIPPSPDDALKIAPEYDAIVLYRWGDPVGIPGNMPAFRMDASNTAAEQEAQAGMHHDGMFFYPLPYASGASAHGLLAMNHEYLDDGLLHPDGRRTWSAEKVRKAQASVGVSVIEVRLQGARWEVVRPSRYARRITAYTPCAISGPAAGSDVDEDRVRPGRSRGARHLQRLRERLHALGHLPHLRGELELLLRNNRARFRPSSGATASARAAATAGRRTTSASTPRSTRTRRTASAGWWRSIRTSRSRSR